MKTNLAGYKALYKKAAQDEKTKVLNAGMLNLPDKDKGKFYDFVKKAMKHIVILHTCYGGTETHFFETEEAADNFADGVKIYTSPVKKLGEVVKIERATE